VCCQVLRAAARRICQIKRDHKGEQFGILRRAGSGGPTVIFMRAHCIKLEPEGFCVASGHVLDRVEDNGRRVKGRQRLRLARALDLSVGRAACPVSPTGQRPRASHNPARSSASGGCGAAHVHGRHAAQGDLSKSVVSSAEGLLLSKLPDSRSHRNSRGTRRSWQALEGPLDGCDHGHEWQVPMYWSAMI